MTKPTHGGKIMEDKKMDTKNRTPKLVQRDFRTYEPEIVTTQHGNEIKIQLCEELINGRWEPFYSTL